MMRNAVQDQIFATFEGDRCFERNKDALERFDPEADFPLKLMQLYRLRPRNVLEVGAANGYRLAAISERYDARVVAIEPSVGAILDGKTSLASGLYHPVCLLTGDHCSKVLMGDVAEDDRIGIRPLRKMLKEHYVEGSFYP